MGAKNSKIKHSFSLQKMKHKWLIIVCIIIVAAVASTILIVNREKQKSTYIFLKELNEYDYSEYPFSDAWAGLVSKAKTPMHYLMLLKRLDSFQLQEQYKKTLIRALWEYPKVQSFLALAIEYYLSNHEDNSFETFFNRVDDLWNSYPNLVRLFYITEYDQKAIKAQGDEILDIYYNLKEYNYTWHEFYTLWQLTDASIFLYFAAVQAHTMGEIAIANKFYSALPVEWQSLNREIYISLAWLLRDKDFLLPIVQSEKNIDDHLNLAGLYILATDFQISYKILSSLIDFYPSTIYNNQRFLELYLWLALRADRRSNVLEVYDYMMESDNYEVISIFLHALYNYDTELYLQFLSAYQFSDELISKSHILQFITLELEDVREESKSTFLWKLIKESQIDQKEKQYWIFISALFFLNEKRFEDFKVLYEEYIVDIPQYEDQFNFYFNVKYNKNFESSKHMSEFITSINSFEYSWWHYYNLSLWGINNNSYAQARVLLNKTLKLLEFEHDNFDIQYVLSQLVRLSVLENDLENAELEFKTLNASYPVSPFREYLGNLIVEAKEALEDENLLQVDQSDDEDI